MQSLSISEKRFVGEYIKQHSHEPWSGIAPLAAGVVSIAGLVLLVSTISISLRNLSDYVFQWVMLPGTVGGSILILFGMGMLFLQKRHSEEEKLCSILKKMIGVGNPTSQFS